MKRPRRAFELRLDVDGDTWEDVANQLESIVQHVVSHGPKCESVGGSPSSGHIVIVTQNPEMTHERYFEELDLYLASERRKRQEAPRESEN